MRLRLYGGRVGLEPRAVVDHDYTFDAGGAKWRRLERNRWAFLIRVYPAPLLALVAPALVLTELVLIPVAFAGGWGAAKLRSLVDVARWFPRLLRERRAIQARRSVDTAEFARLAHPGPRLAVHTGPGPQCPGSRRASRLLVPGSRGAWPRLIRSAGWSDGSGSR